MNTVLGNAVKVGVLDATCRHLKAMGFDIYAGGATATFSGSGAYVTWDYTGSRIRFRINCPALPDNAVLTRGEADIVVAYFLHEMGHVAYTDNRILRGEMLNFSYKSTDQHLLHSVWNGLEDPRIEAATIRSGAAHGARHLFLTLLNRLTGGVGGDWNPTDLRHSPFALAVAGRAAYGYGNEFANTLLPRIPAPKRAVYEKAISGLLLTAADRKGTAECLELAKTFIAEFRAIDGQARKVFTPPSGPEEGGIPEQQDQPETESDYNDNGSTEVEPQPQPRDGAEYGDQTDDQTDDDQTDDDQTSGDQTGDDGFDADEDGEGESLAGGEGESDDADEGEAGDGGDAEGDDADEGEAGGGGSEGEGEAGGESEDDAEDVGGETDGEGGDGFSKSGGGEFKDNGTGAGEAHSPEPSINDMLDKIAGRTKNPIDLAPFQQAHRSHASDWSIFREVGEEGHEKSMDRLQKNLGGIGAAIRRSLVQILVSPELCGWDSGATSGRFDGRRVSRLLAGQENVFKHRWEVEGLESAVSILIDMSGSMSGSRAQAARDMATILATSCERSNVPVEVLGFTTQGLSHSANFPTKGLAGEVVGNTFGGRPSRLIVFKSFTQRMHSVGRVFSRMPHLTGGGTPDYAAIRSTVEGIQTRPEKRKVVLVLTDGCGESWKVKTVVDAKSLHGVDVIGIGVQTCGMARSYQTFAEVCDLNELAKTGLGLILKTLKAAAKGRRVA